jgi:hypothetical protein
MRGLRLDLNVRTGSSTEMLRLSISRLLFLAIADAPTPPGTPSRPRQGYRPRHRSGRGLARAALFDDLVSAQQNR